MNVFELRDQPVADYAVYVRSLIRFRGQNEMGPARLARLASQEDKEAGRELRGSPPDFLLANSVMLELLLSRPTTLRGTGTACSTKGSPCERIRSPRRHD